MLITAVPTYSSFLAELSQRADVSSLAPDLNKKSLKLYMNSARLLFRTAELYKRTGDLPNAFVMYLKYSNLLVYVFPKHRQYQEQSSRPDLQELKRNALLAMDALEEIKAGLEPWWEAHVKPLIDVKTTTGNPVDSTSTVISPETDTVNADIVIKNNDDHLASERRRSEVEKYYRDQFKASLSNHQNNADTLQAKIKLQSEPKVPSSPIELPPRPSIAAKVEQIFLTEAGMPLRTVKIPYALIDVFMRIASQNTSNNIETCGVLGGTLSSQSNSFTITHLIVPKQHGTSDTCVMVKEEEVAEAAISNSLMTLGWIHTHPTQSCFMSSIDQHTQFPFQALMAEAIAVVVAPRRTPNYGVFRLTDPPGMPTISRCGQSGFHAHPDNMYCELVHATGKDGQRGGHVKMDHSAALTVIDLRHK